MIDVDWNLAPEGAVELVQYGNRVTWRKGIKIWCYTQEGWYDYVSDWKTIATRSTQTKTVADAVEQEGEKWTHRTNSGYKCKILVKEPDSKTLKPIKPTISNKEYKLLADYANCLNCAPVEFDQYISETYDVTN